MHFFTYEREKYYSPIEEKNIMMESTWFKPDIHDTLTIAPQQHTSASSYNSPDLQYLTVTMSFLHKYDRKNGSFFPLEHMIG